MTLMMMRRMMEDDGDGGDDGCDWPSWGAHWGAHRAMSAFLHCFVSMNCFQTLPSLGGSLGASLGPPFRHFLLIFRHFTFLLLFVYDVRCSFVCLLLLLHMSYGMTLYDINNKDNT